jgi:hypothetical protein
LLPNSRNFALKCFHYWPSARSHSLPSSFV